MRGSDLIDQVQVMSSAVRHAMLKTVHEVFDLISRDSEDTIAALRRQWELTSAVPPSTPDKPRPVLSQLNFISELRDSIRIVNSTLNMPGRAWSLTVDDADLSPDLMDVLVDSMRSDESDLFLKVTVSPSRGAHNSRRAITSLPLLDYDVIPLDAEHARYVARALLTRGAKQQAVDHDFRLRDLRRESTINSLRAKDQSFSEWLNDSGPDSTLRSSRLRAVWVLIEWRNEMLTDSGHQRSKPTFDAYTNPEVVPLIFGENPRSARLCLDSVALRQPSMSSVIKDQVELHRALLASAGALTLMNAIGGYLRAACFGTFIPKPPGSVYIDAAVPESVIAAVETLCNLGLLRFATSPYAAVLGDVRGATMQLAGIAFPMYRLPPRSGPPVSLSKILDHEKPMSTVFK